MIYRSITTLLLIIAMSAAAYSRNGIWHNVVSLCDDINAKSPEKGRGFALLGSYYARGGDFANAAESYLEALSRNPSNVKLYVELAKVYRQAGDEEQEFIVYQRALSEGIHDARIHSSLGDFLFRIMDMDAAEREYEAAIGLDPVNAHAYYKIGLIDMARGQYRSSLSRFQRAGSLDPGNMVYQEYLEMASALVAQTEP